MKHWGSSFGLLFALLAISCGQSGGPVPDAGGPKPTVDSGMGTGLCLDNDGDGAPGTGDCKGQELGALDCDDADPTVFPGAAESCNGRDDNCNGEKDEGLEVLTYLKDADGDGVGGDQKTGSGCAAPPAGSALAGGDCNDADATVHPGAAEVCNGVDDDCKGGVDDGLAFKDFFPDVDSDGYGDATAAPQSSCMATLPGKVTNKTDCNDQNGTMHPDAAEQCNKLDDNCDGTPDNGIAFTNYYPDGDGDGFGAANGAPESSCAVIAGKVTSHNDCDDANAAVKPGAAEVCNGVDDNCAGGADEGLAFATYYPDVDGDGYGASTGTPVSSCKPVSGKVTNSQDCNDADPAVKPGVAEQCNGVDDNCSGLADEGLTFTNYYPDADGDGFGSASAAAINACKPVTGRVANNQDCNDANAAVKPGATEICNGVDDNCAGGVDDGLAFKSYYPDVDGDGFGAASATAQSACAPVAGKVANNQDCNDANAAVKPGATEICNGVDDNCSGAPDEGLTFVSYWPDVDGDGFGSATASAQSACAQPSGKVTNNTDCNDGNAFIHPGAAETCNLTDDNCDGAIDNGTVTQNYYPDLDSDGYGAAGSLAQASCAPVSGKVPNNTDCNDGNGAIHPGAAEVCNGADDNCAGGVDEGLTFLSYYPDLDSDGFGAAGSTPQSACAAVSGKVTNDSDCNDGSAAIKPTATEICNGVDDNCSGAADEGLATTPYYPDSDQDGFGSASAPAQDSCRPVAGKVTSHTDCNDGSASIHPGAAEACNGVDDNCAGGVDEGNPGGGASCSTGQPGVCQAGTVTCQASGLTCLRNSGPSAEQCDGLDNDCDSAVDEDFANKNQPCSAGLGVCLRSGTFVCTADKSATTCSVTAGPPTAAACDGLDNDCDGVVDEPGFVGATTLHNTAWKDLEVAPYYFSSGGCQGGVTGSGTDALAGGALVLSVGTSGVQFQKLDTQGRPVGGTSSPAGLSYTDVAMAQSGDGFVIAGMWSVSPEIDLYYVDYASGVMRAKLWSQFKTGNALDSLRVVRGNGRRVTLLWREAGVGLKLAQVEPFFDGTTWTLQKAGGGTPLVSQTLVAGAVAAGVGADSATIDWEGSQTCVSTATKRKLGVAYLPTAQSLRHFTVLEDGSGKSATETTVRTETGTLSLKEPELVFFRAASADQFFVAFTTSDSGTTPSEDLNYWLTNNPTWQYAYLNLAGENGADSITRPRASATATGLTLVAQRYVADASGLKRQVMTRSLDLNGAKLPAGAAVELSATTGACPAGDPDCRPGNKDALTVWSPFGKVYLSASGASPAGSYSAGLTCQ